MTPIIHAISHTLLVVSIIVNLAMWKGYIPTPPPIDWLSATTKEDK